MQQVGGTIGAGRISNECAQDVEQSHVKALESAIERLAFVVQRAEDLEGAISGQVCPEPDREKEVAKTHIPLLVCLTHSPDHIRGLANKIEGHLDSIRSMLRV